MVTYPFYVSFISRGPLPLWTLPCFFEGFTVAKKLLCSRGWDGISLRILNEVSYCETVELPTAMAEKLWHKKGYFDKHNKMAVWVDPHLLNGLAKIAPSEGRLIWILPIQTVLPLWGAAGFPTIWVDTAVKQGISGLSIGDDL